MSRTYRKEKLKQYSFRPDKTILTSGFAFNGESAYPTGYDDLVGLLSKRFAKRELVRARRRADRQIESEF